jgi:hypothetical protein
MGKSINKLRNRHAVIIGRAQDQEWLTTANDALSRHREKNNAARKANTEWLASAAEPNY